MIKVIFHVAKAAIAVITALLFFSCGMEGFKKVDGSGTVITQKRTSEPEFTSVTAESGIEVIIEQGGTRSITVEADDNLQEHIKTEIANGELTISSDVNIRKGTKKVTVVLPEIKSIESEGGATVSNKNTIKAESIAFSASSGSSMNITVEAENVSGESGSGSSLTLKGKADRLETESGSGSTLNAKGLTAKKVVSESGSGSTTIVNPVEDLSADASSGSTINYVTTPSNLNKKTSSGGTVAQQ